MFISPINSINKTNSKMFITKKDLRYKSINQTTTDTILFKKANPVIAKNQMKILLTQDIWAPKLKIKMPESPIEKEALLEVLSQRLKLDQYVRLTNEKFNTKAKLALYRDLSAENPNSEECIRLRTDLDKKGNLKSYFNTLEKRIDLAAKKNAPALNYFKEIEKLENEYLQRKLIKYSQIEKFMIQVNKNNINPEGLYSTEELIKIIESGQIPRTTNTLPVNQILSKKQLLNVIETQYEQELRKTVDVYSRNFGHYQDAQKSRQAIETRYQNSIKKYPEIQKILPKIYANIERRYTHKVLQIADVEVYPIGKIWQEMAVAENAIKRLINEAKSLRAELKINPNNQEAQKALKVREEVIASMKSSWINGMLYSIKYENLNREKMIKAGKDNVYSYLINENQTLKMHKFAYKEYMENENNIPDKAWEKILGL